MRNGIWIAFLLLLSALTADASQRKKSVVIVGDSQACGAGYAAKAALGAGVEVRTECKVGSHVSEWASRIDRAKLSSSDDLVVVYLGSNDYWGRPDPSGVLAAVKRSGARRCVWVGPPIIRGAKGTANSHLKEAVAAEGTCSYFDSTGLRLAQPDGVHPTFSGHVAWLRAATAGVLRD